MNNMADFFKVDFADIKGVEVTLVRIEHTFEGHTEGTYHMCSERILESMIKEAQKEGRYFKFTPDQVEHAEPHPYDFKKAKGNDLLKPDEILRSYLYQVSANHDYANRLTVYWFGNAPAADESLRDIINSRTLSINFMDNAYKIDIDNL